MFPKDGSKVDPVADTPDGETLASATATTVGVPTLETIEGKVATACALTPTPATADVPA